MPETTNGIGTIFYGCSDLRDDGSYIATKWFVIFFIPIFPLGSFRVLLMDSKFNLFPPGVSKTYHSIRVPLNKKQVILVYGYYAFFALIGVLCAIFKK